MKRPAFQFYPADWRKDVELRSCSIAARGLWIDLLCLAHECEPYGQLIVNGRAMTAAQMAGQVGLAVAQCAKLLQELLDNGVARKTPEGVIYSKRMVEDEDLRQRRAEGGKAGSEFGSLGAEHGSKGGRPRKDTGDKKPPSEPPLEPPLKPPPSSSSSSSTSVDTPIAPRGAAEGAGCDTHGQTIPCPYDRIVGLYHEVLPALPRAKLMPASRQKALRKVWGWVLSSTKGDGQRRATTTEEALHWLRGYFGRAQANDFLMGRTPRSAEHANWQCDLDFLLTDKGMKQVIEKTQDAA